MKRDENILPFLLAIFNTIAAIVIWLIGNLLVGIYLGYAFFDHNITWKNIVYYIAALTTLYFVIRFIRNRWKS